MIFMIRINIFVLCHDYNWSLLKHSGSEETSSASGDKTTTPKRRSVAVSVATPQKQLDEAYITSNLKKVLDYCVQRNTNNNESSLNLVNKKSDMSLRILESLYVQRAHVAHYDTAVQKLVTLLDKVNQRLIQLCDQLVNLFL